MSVGYQKGIIEPDIIRTPTWVIQVTGTLVTQSKVPFTNNSSLITH